MERLCYDTLNEIEYDGYILKDAPERVLQFGEGNFLRGFADHFIDIMNEDAAFNCKVVICQPRGGKMCDVINGQDGLYTLLLRGKEMGCTVDYLRIISCISRCINPVRDYDDFIDCASNPDLRFIISNTTEAGIVYDPKCELSDRPASGFPGKLTQFLFERYKKNLPGFIILSCELIDRNGDELRKCVEKYTDQWKLPEDFSVWLREQNMFCSTLVDRIVPGYPKDEAEDICDILGYRDELLDAGELFASWVIEADDSICSEFPVDKTDLPILITDNVDLYKKRKVRMLNGAHTSMVTGAFIAGFDTVGECMGDDVIRGYVKNVLYNEIIPVLYEFDRNELVQYADNVIERFDNPYIHHELISISLNTTAKWKARVLPTIVEYYEQYGKLPPLLTFSFASYLYFYQSGREFADGCLVGKRDGEDFFIRDDRSVLEEFYRLKDAHPEELIISITENKHMWGDTLRRLPGFMETVAGYLMLINNKGMYEAIREIQV